MGAALAVSFLPRVTHHLARGNTGDGYRAPIVMFNDHAVSARSTHPTK
jgi:hypothetical protein